MPKNIVICSDGTGNTTVKGRGTNVFKIYEAVDIHGHKHDPNETPQIAFYDDGVGTHSLKPIRLAGGAVGFGLGRNVRQLYGALARAYEPGDRIFMFGFSRGAFTVRTLAGLVDTCGIPDVSGKTNAEIDRVRKESALAEAGSAQPDVATELVDLADYKVSFADGRPLDALADAAGGASA